MLENYYDTAKKDLFEKIFSHLQIVPPLTFTYALLSLDKNIKICSNPKNTKKYSHAIVNVGYANCKTFTAF
jgi:hypothetical protein